MYNDSKLMLSAEEQQMVNNTNWILTKRIIIDKVGLLFGSLADSQKLIIEQQADWLNPEIVNSTLKLLKGENYLKLPYVLLDYPRFFEIENIFAVRTMFWWGNFFSITLHLSGSYKQMFQKKIIERLSLSKQIFFICIHDSEWQHHFGSDNYILVKQLSDNNVQNNIYNKQFIKLAIKFPLHPWNSIPTLLNEAFDEIINLLKT